MLKAIIGVNLIFRISHFARSDQTTTTNLQLRTIEKRQYGQYTCKAANKLGEAEARLELFGKSDNITEGTFRYQTQTILS